MKRYIKSSQYDDYDPWAPTTMIDDQLPEAVQIFMDSDDVDYKMLKAAADAFWADYDKFPNGNSIDSLDSKYDDDKGRFYKKYRPFVDKCKSLMSVGNVSGYGRDDYFKIKFADICKGIDYRFPYGWKYNAR